MPFGAQRADHRQAVALGQHAVDDQHVVFAVERQREALLAVGGVIGDMADLAEGVDEIVRGVAVIFDDQQAHAEWARSADLRRYYRIPDVGGDCGQMRT